MRCRISPDASKLVICTTGGYLIIVHNLDLQMLAKDLHGFRVSNEMIDIDGNDGRMTILFGAFGVFIYVLREENKFAWSKGKSAVRVRRITISEPNWKLNGLEIKDSPAFRTKVFRLFQVLNDIMAH